MQVRLPSDLPMCGVVRVGTCLAIGRWLFTRACGPTPTASEPFAWPLQVSWPVPCSVPHNAAVVLSAIARATFASPLVRARRPSTCFWPRAGLTKTCRSQWRAPALAADGSSLAQPSLSAWAVAPLGLQAAGWSVGPVLATFCILAGARPRGRRPCQSKAMVHQEGRQAANACRPQGSGEETRAGALRSSNA
jgi:hypothetical protein